MTIYIDVALVLELASLAFIAWDLFSAVKSKRRAGK
jgi:hypothetical protein